MLNKAHPSALLVVLSAPSGGGKTTLCGQIIARNPNIVRAVTCTTRKPRKGERDGVDYLFLSRSDFLKRVKAGDFIEHAEVHGNLYGTLESVILDHLKAGKDVILIIDVQGAAAIRRRAAEDPVLARALVTVFVTPPTLKVLEERLAKRATDSPEVIASRLEGARQEVAEWPNYDYLIISASMSEDFGRLQAIVDAEKMRQPRVHFCSFD
ncbi:MAG: guanylate kinase [Verrucomicrobia bacterium]|nr:guanylate kinase [Verrucomicrobiota bacterium]